MGVLDINYLYIFQAQILSLIKLSVISVHILASYQLGLKGLDVSNLYYNFNPNISYQI